MADKRGYTCGLWQLFHTLASRLPDTENSGAVWLAAVKGFVASYFQCTECAKHFVRHAGGEEAVAVARKRDAVLWMWRTHNIVRGVGEGWVEWGCWRACRRQCRLGRLPACLPARWPTRGLAPANLPACCAFLCLTAPTPPLTAGQPAAGDGGGRGRQQGRPRGAPRPVPARLAVPAVQVGLLHLLLKLGV